MAGHYGKRRWFKRIAVGLGIVGLGSALISCQRATPEERAQQVVERVSSKLDLTEAQKAKLELVKVEFLAARSEWKKNHKAERQELVDMILTDRMNENRVNQIIDGKQKVFDRFSPRVVKKLADFHESLNDEQKKEVHEFLSRRLERRS